MTSSAQVNLAEPCADERLVGGKAAGLMRCRSLGLDVPPFFVVPVEHFRAHLQAGAVASAVGEAALAWADVPVRAGAPSEEAVAAARRIGDAVVRQPLDPGVAQAVARAMEGLAPGPFSVRSSMVGEDSARHSFAGQLETFLYQNGAEQVLHCMVRCWASAFSDRALIYAARLGIAPTQARMAVVVQQMVDADLAGVTFTINPLSGRRDECLVTAAYGLGEGVVSGEADADEYVWSRADGERDARIASKETRVVRAGEGRGTQLQPTPELERNNRALSPAQVTEVCETGLALAAEAGTAVDVEWCYSGGRLYVLQARPVTASKPVPDSASRTVVFDNSNIQESYTGVTTPLTFSFASRAYATVFRQFARTLGVSEERLAGFEPAARNMLGFIDGRVYYNLGSWYSLLRLLPGYERNKEETEKVMWHLRESVEDSVGEDRSRFATLRGYVNSTRVGAKILLRFLRLDAEIERFNAHFDDVYGRVDRTRLREASLSELHATGEMLFRELLDKWEAPNINDFRVMMLCGRLRRLLERTRGDSAATGLADLLGGIENIESIQPTRILLDIARRARTKPAWTAALTEGTPQEAFAGLQSRAPDLADKLDAYLERYGDRCIGELKLETVPLREDPRFVIAVLRNYLDAADADPDELARRELERFERARSALSRSVGPLTRLTLPLTIAWARKAVKAREQLRLLRAFAFGLARDIVRAMGLRLHEAGLLDHPRDVLYLTVDELWAVQEGRAVSVDLAAIVKARRGEGERHAAVEPPGRIESAGSPYLPGARREDGPPNGAANGALKGLGCCAGVVEAPVRVIHDPHEGADVNGRVICALRTDPGWAPLFPSASGLIVERGSALSHSAVVARELGLPTVVGVAGITRILRDGEVVRLDGGAGTVERLGTTGPDEAT